MLCLPFTPASFRVACALSLIGILLNGEMALAVPFQNNAVEVTFLVDMPDPSMSAVLEVEGEVHPMETGLWGAWEASVEVPMNATFNYRFGTPAGPVGMAWESPTGACAEMGTRWGLVNGSTTLDVVCFNECVPCLGCTDPFASNYNPLANLDSPSELCSGSGQGGCTYSEAINFDQQADWDNGTCAFEGMVSNCPDQNADGIVGVTDMLMLLAAFGEECAVVISSDVDPLEALIQQQIDAMTWQQKIAQIHRNSFWTTAGNSSPAIPGFTMSDGPHGVRLVDATSFPVGIGIAASWNRQLAREVGVAMGEEFHAYDKHQQLGPALDLCRDPRNGRSPETGGEDPFLTAHMNVEVVQGIQQNPVIATIKHFNAVNKQEFRHTVNHVLTERQLMEHYGYNFRRVMQDAGAMSVMNAYNLVNGEKSAENSDLLTDILKKKWGFPFYVVSDWGSVWDASKALKAGCDLEMDVNVSEYELQLTNDYQNGAITDEDLDRAVRRVLRVKYLNGMMDNIPASNPITGANTPEHQALCLDAGREAIVLLKNADGILPISPSATVAIVGPSAAVAQLDGFGSSWVDPPYAITPLQGLLNKIPASQIEFAPGCDINSTDTVGFAAAREVAMASDIVIFVGGLDQTQEGENYAPGPVDRTNDSVELPGMQQLLIQELAEVNPNVIAVIKSGGICAVPDALGHMKGFLYAFYPGMEGGNAIADVLYGDVNPSGKLPVTMPVNDAQMPAWNDDYSDDYNGGYRYYDELDITPQFPFGFGLSYADFAYGNLQLDAASYEAGQPITATVQVTNIGAVPGAEVVQFYLTNEGAPVWMPEKELKGFEKVEIQPGETVTVEVTIGANEMYYYSETLGRYEVALGQYVLRAGGSSGELGEGVEFDVVGSTPAPDFEVTRIFTYPRYPFPGDSLMVCALVKNQGTAVVNAGEDLVVSFSIGGQEVASMQSLSDTLWIGGAAFQCASASNYTVPELEAVDIEAMVDAGNDWTEWMEDNNSLTYTMDVLDPDEAVVPNLCYLKPATATSQESSELAPAMAVDGSFSTRWSSDFYDPQTITVDLLDVYTLDVISLSWEAAYSSEYKLNVSMDGQTWTTLVHDTQADGGNDMFYPEVEAQFIQVEGIQRATQWGHSLWEIQAFGELAGTSEMAEMEMPAIELIPNPAQDEVRLQGLTGEAQMVIFNMRGQRLWKGTVRSNEPIILPRLRMPAGAYVLRLEGTDFNTSLNLIVD